VMTMTFIFSGKWIGAGWAAKLNDFIAADPGLSAGDFLAGAMAPMKAGNDVLALPFVAESTLMVYRADLVKQAGIRPPETFDELLAAAPKLQTADTKAYMGRGLGGVHWIWPNYLYAYGGRFFADPIKDMTPQLASPESIKAAEVYGKLCRDYSVPGVASYAEPQSSGGMMEGRTAIYIDALAWANDPLPELEAQVMRKLNAAKGGGYLPQSDHSVPSNVSAERYEFVLNLLRKHGKYPLQLGSYDIPGLGRGT